MRWRIYIINFSHLYFFGSWLIQQILVALGYTHLSDHVAALTHTNFATQLEAYGLWHWAIFVMLHLRDSSRRQIAVKDLLLRHIEIDDSPEYVKREQFLKEELGISSVWIHQAKAIKSSIDKRYLVLRFLCFYCSHIGLYFKIYSLE